MHPLSGLATCYVFQIAFVANWHIILVIPNIQCVSFHSLRSVFLLSLSLRKRFFKVSNKFRFVPTCQAFFLDRRTCEMAPRHILICFPQLISIATLIFFSFPQLLCVKRIKLVKTNLNA